MTSRPFFSLRFASTILLPGRDGTRTEILDEDHIEILGKQPKESEPFFAALWILVLSKWYIERSTQWHNIYFHIAGRHTHMFGSLLISMSSSDVVIKGPPNRRRTPTAHQKEEQKIENIFTTYDEVEVNKLRVFSSTLPVTRIAYLWASLSRDREKYGDDVLMCDWVMNKYAWFCATILVSHNQSIK